MTAEVIRLRPSFDPVLVEITSPGTLRDGRRLYTVDYAEADGEGSVLWGGHDLAEAWRVAREIGAEDSLPVVDLTDAEATEIPVGPVH